MGVKYQIINNEGKVIARTKEDWPIYKRSKKFSLEIWEGRGKGWLNLCSNERRSAGIPRGKYGYCNS